MTTYTLDRLDTGEHLSAYQVRDEVDRLDSIAEQAPVQPEPWVARTPDHIHDDRCRAMQHAEYADEPTPEAGAHIPSTDDVRERIRLSHASGRLASRLDAKAQIWREIANQAWASQGGTPRISERYTDRRDALLATYEAECERIKQSLTEPRVEYGGHVYTEAGGFVETVPPPADRPELENLARRDKERRQREQRAIAPAPTPEPQPERRGWWRRKWDALLAWDGSGA